MTEPTPAAPVSGGAASPRRGRPDAVEPLVRRGPPFEHRRTGAGHRRLHSAAARARRPAAARWPAPRPPGRPARGSARRARRWPTQLARPAVAGVLGDGGGHQVAGAGQAGEGLAAPAVGKRQLVHLGEHARRGGTGDVGAAVPGRRRRRASRRSWRTRRARRRSRRRCARRGGRPRPARRRAGGAASASWVASTHRGAALDRLAGVGGTGQVRHRAGAHALGHVGGGRGAERRDEALRGDQAPRFGRRCGRPPSRPRPAGSGRAPRTRPGRRRRTRCRPQWRRGCRPRAGPRAGSRRSRARRRAARPGRPCGSRAGPRGPPARAALRRRCPSSRRRRPRPCAEAAARRATPTGAPHTARCAR